MVVGVLIPVRTNFFAINLPFTMKQYKVDNIANFVYYGKNQVVHEQKFKDLHSSKYPVSVGRSMLNLET